MTTSRRAQLEATTRLLLPLLLWVVAYRAAEYGIPPSARHFIDAHRPELVAVAAVGYFVLLWRAGLWTALVASLYIVGFPVWLVFKTFGRVIVMPWETVRWIRSHYTIARGFTFAVSVLLIAATAIELSDRRWVLTTASLALFSLTATVWLLSFYWVLKPRSIILQLVNTVLAGAMPACDDFVGRKDKQPNPPTEARKKLKDLERYVGIFKRIVTRLLSPRASLLAFIATFMLMFIAIVMQFGFIVHAFWKADPSTFEARGPSSLTDALFFSITTITTSAISDVTPSSRLAKLLVSCELLMGLSFVSLLALSFSAVHTLDHPAFQQRWAALQSIIDRRLYYLREYAIADEDNHTISVAAMRPDKNRIPLGTQFIQVGSRVRHDDWGPGKVLGAWNVPEDPHFLAEFEDVDLKILQVTGNNAFILLPGSHRT